MSPPLRSLIGLVAPLLWAVLASSPAAQGPGGAGPSPESRDHPTRVWATAGSGVYTKPLWAGAGVGVGVERGPLAGRIAYAVGEAFWGQTTTNIVGVSVGPHWRAGRFDLAALVGPAIVWGTDGAPYPRERYLTAGVVAEASAFFEVGPGFGLGAEVRASVNPAVSTVGGGPALRVKLAGGR